MAHAQVYTYHQPNEPYVIRLDDRHIVEVKKKGARVLIGIYVLTATGKKRGILLPRTTWECLEKFTSLIDAVTILVAGNRTSGRLVERVINEQQNIILQEPLNLSTVSQTVPTKYLYNPVNTTLTNDIKAWASQSMQPQQQYGTERETDNNQISDGGCGQATESTTSSEFDQTLFSKPEFYNPTFEQNWTTQNPCEFIFPGHTQLFLQDPPSRQGRTTLPNSSQSSATKNTSTTLPWSGITVQQGTGQRVFHKHEGNNEILPILEYNGEYRQPPTTGAVTTLQSSSPAGNVDTYSAAFVC